MNYKHRILLSEIQLQLAQPEQVEALVQLVNQAYRPQQAHQSWSNEANWITGERTNAEQITALFRPNHYLLTLCQYQQLLACVHIQHLPDFAYIGMLTTAIKLQNQGLGKLMLHYAEDFIATQLKCSQIKMEVLSTRQELIDFYLRRGYQLSGHIEDYPIDAGIGLPKVSGISVLQLVKHLGAN